MEEGHGVISLMMSSSPSLENSGLRERNYMGLSDCSSVDSSTISSLSEENKSTFNLGSTELRLGLPGSESPERNQELSLLSSGRLDEKPLFPLLPMKDSTYLSSQKTVVSGNKRGFSDAMDGFSEVKSTVCNEGNWMFPASGSDSGTAQSVAQGKLHVNSGVKSVALKEHSRVENAMLKEIAHPKVSSDVNHNSPANNTSNQPAAKAQVVGWPPIRSFRKNTLATTTKNSEEVDGKPGPSALYVKVSMDGAPYLRKVDLSTYYEYQELSSALEKMFSCFIGGQSGPHGASGRDMSSESKNRDLLHGSEFVLAYEDKDGDWMQVGDVPWDMFIDSCKRLRIMKNSDAIGLAQGAADR
ncbi:hypothetical protein MKW94_005753 [Papaver nudicaule]|uniref:Auxin-responsive protein n=1 Tax=Papaver nudicaule TaxID=74823 RepID=A0AA41S5Q3_PAPNU|nr:hypothetical protein [Papaver nudicaule]